MLSTIYLSKNAVKRWYTVVLRDKYSIKRAKLIIVKYIAFLGTNYKKEPPCFSTWDSKSKKIEF
jgi:hypothetical protein